VSGSLDRTEFFLQQFVEAGIVAAVVDQDNCFYKLSA
jgi:hypothetical protein